MTAAYLLTNAVGIDDIRNLWDVEGKSNRADWLTLFYDIVVAEEAIRLVQGS